jgi:LPS export ABC transporter protein LptC
MNKRTILLYSLGVLLLIGSLYYFLREEALAPDVSRSISQPKQEISFEKTAMVEEKNGKRLWELSAEAVNMDSKANKVYLTNVKGIFYSENGGSVNIIARKGVADTLTKEIFLEGEVTAVTNEGATFTAPNARWSGELRLFHANGGVKLTRGDTVMTGDTLDSDVDLEKVKIRGNAKVVRGGGV